MSEWISVKDKLPKPATPVIVAGMGCHSLEAEVLVSVGVIDHDAGWSPKGILVAHWMPLPALPAGLQFSRKMIRDWMSSNK